MPRVGGNRRGVRFAYHAERLMHNLVVGISGSGKSRLMRERIVPLWRGRGYAVLVLDPVGQDWLSSGATWQTRDPYRFLDAAQRSQRCILVVDESDETLRATAQQERDLKYLATRSRNDGHVAYFLAQRAMQVPPSYRNQCSRVYAFQQTQRDAEVVAELVNQPALLETVRLPLGTCIEAKCFGIPRKIAVFDPGTKRSI